MTTTLRLPHLGLEDDRTESQRDAARSALVRMWSEAQASLFTWDETQSKFVPDVEAAQRMLAAGEMFRHLEPWQRVLLRQAASRSNVLFRALYAGEWTAASRALRGLAARLNEKAYNDLATHLEPQVPHELEGEILPRHIRKGVAAAA